MTETSDHANRRLMLLNRVATSLMTGPETPEHLQAVFADAALELGAEHCLHYRADEADAATRVLTLTWATGLDEAQTVGVRRLGSGEGMCGEVARTHQPMIVDNLHQRDDERTAFLRALGGKAYACLPLLSHGTLFGTVALVAKQQTTFPSADVELFRMLADQLAATLDRARLVQRLRDSETRYRGAVITSRIGAWETDVVARTRTWTQEGMALFGLDLPDGRGQVGGENDEFWRALHPADRHLMAQFHQTADREDNFPAEYRIVRPDGTVLWVSGRGRVVARGPDGKAQRMANIVVDITDRKRSEEHVQMLMREISHRSKNLLAVVQAIAGQTVRTAGTLKEFEKRFGLRLQGLAASHDLLVHEDWRGAPLADLARQQLAPFAEPGSARLVLAGPDVVLTAAAAQTVGLALHELATNAIKYGAWSVPTGKVSVSWAAIATDATPEGLRLSWTESGGPAVRRPTRKGFGHTVIEGMVAQSVDGAVEIDYSPTGLRWALSIPLANVVGSIG